MIVAAKTAVERAIETTAAKRFWVVAVMGILLSVRFCGTVPLDTKYLAGSVPNLKNVGKQRFIRGMILAASCHSRSVGKFPHLLGCQL
jgi:hypothetical protein